MRKKLVSLGLAGLMGAMSVMPAFAANGVTNVETLTDGKAGYVQDIDGNQIDPSAKAAFEDLEDNENSIADVDYYNGLEGDFADTAQSKETEVAVQQAMSYVLQLPAFISMNGAKGEANEAEFHIGLYADIAGSSTITAVPNLTGATEGVTNGTAYTAFADGSGTFPMKEDGAVKKDLVATIEIADTNWTIADDAENDVIGSFVDGTYTYKEHNGKVSVADLKAGTWRNTINFDVTYENSDN